MEDYPSSSSSVTRSRWTNRDERESVQTLDNAHEQQHHLERRWSGPGWRPPTELGEHNYASSSSSSSRRPWFIGSGVVGGVPERGGVRAQDLTALGHELWDQLGGPPKYVADAGAAAAGAAAPSSSSSGSTSSTPSSAASTLPYPSDPRLAALLSASNVTLANPAAYDLNSSVYNDEFLCRPLSECEPCPGTTRNHPFCRPYGNRKLTACRLVSGPAGGASASTFGQGTKPRPPPDVDFVGWEACGKVVRNETRDYLEFVVSLRRGASWRPYASRERGQ